MAFSCLDLCSVKALSFLPFFSILITLGRFCIMVTGVHVLRHLLLCSHIWFGLVSCKAQMDGYSDALIVGVVF